MLNHPTDFYSETEDALGADCSSPLQYYEDLLFLYHSHAAAVQRARNTGSYIWLSSFQSWKQTTCRWRWWGFRSTVSAPLSSSTLASLMTWALLKSLWAGHTNVYSLPRMITYLVGPFSQTRLVLHHILKPIRFCDLFNNSSFYLFT